MGIPSDKHPRIGYTPEKCSINQQGPVWFLADKGESGVEVQTLYTHRKGNFIPSIEWRVRLGYNFEWKKR